MKQTRNVAILLFPEVEVLDFCGPFEVFAVAERNHDPKPFHVYTCAEKTEPIWTRGQLSVNPRHPLISCPQPDILVIPGGWGTREQMNYPPVIDWIRAAADRAELILSVCTGSLLLAKAGLLDGLSATTHHGAFDVLQEVAPKSLVCRGQRVVDNGKIVTAAGISAGIDASLHVVGRLLGNAVARETAEHMEYHWNP